MTSPLEPAPAAAAHGPRSVLPLVPPRPQFLGGNSVRLLQGGAELFPAMCATIGQAKHEVWLATYIFENDPAGRMVADALVAAARRGVRVHVVIDGFGSKDCLAQVMPWLRHPLIETVVFRPMERWWAWLQPGQLRRLHQKLCAVDGLRAYVGGINIIDDLHDQAHGWFDTPRLDFAVELSGPVALPVQQTAHAMWARANLGRDWREEVRALARSAQPVSRTMGLLRELRMPVAKSPLAPVPVAFVVRDNLRQRRAIERAYVEAIRGARSQVDLICPYFYPGRRFRHALRQAAQRGVAVRLLLQGKIDYRLAGLAARVLYQEMLAHGVRIFEYTPAFLHAKVAVVDDQWATVGSSNIDPLSLLLNLEANAVVRDAAFAAQLRQRIERAMAESVEITAAPMPPGWRGWLGRGLVAWIATAYLRWAGVTGRY